MSEAAERDEAADRDEAPEPAPEPASAPAPAPSALGTGATWQRLAILAAIALAVRVIVYVMIDYHVRADAEDYLEHCAEAWLERATATGFLRLSESIDLQCVDPRDVRVPLTVVAVRQDLLVPVDDLRALARRAGGACELHVIDSRYGHDAFLKEPEAIGAIVAQALAAGALA